MQEDDVKCDVGGSEWLDPRLIEISRKCIDGDLYPRGITTHCTHHTSI